MAQPPFALFISSPLTAGGNPHAFRCNGNPSNGSSSCGKRLQTPSTPYSFAWICEQLKMHMPAWQQERGGGGGCCRPPLLDSFQLDFVVRSIFMITLHEGSASFALIFVLCKVTPNVSSFLSSSLPYLRRGELG